jgi:exosortase
MQTKASSSWLEEFKREFPAYWREIPHKGFFFALLTCWLALFQFLGNPTFGYVNTASLFGWLYNAYSGPQSEDSHGLLIPFVVLALLWYKRTSWGPLRKDIWPLAMGGIFLALVLHIVGYVIQQPILSTASLIVGLVFISGLAWGKAWLQQTWFPLVLLIFCIPISAQAESLTFPLRLFSTKITVLVCHYLLSINVIQDGVVLKGPQGDYYYELVTACSGIRSLVALFALTTIYGFVTFKTFWKQMLCVVVSAPLAVTGNVLRLVGIVVAREAFGEKAAEFVHEWFGFVTFGLAIACVMILGAWLREDDARGPEVSPKPSDTQSKS